MNKPTVAIITRTKDRPTFLRRAMESIHSQTYTDFVHLVYNDAGDESVVTGIVDEFRASGTKNIVIVTGEGSNGMEDTIFNKAIRATDSIYVAIHDDDDTWHPRFLELTVKHLEGTGRMGVVARTNKVVEEVQSDGSIETKKSTHWMPDLKAINLYRQCIDNQMTAITFLYRRAAYDELGGYDDNLAVCGDWDFGIRFLQKYDVDYLDPGYPLAFYHHRRFKKNAEGNTSGAGNSRFHYYTNYLLNKYLREELHDGRLGVGYIMSKLRYDQSNLSRMAHRVLPSSIASRLKRRVQD